MTDHNFKDLLEINKLLQILASIESKIIFHVSFDTLESDLLVLKKD